MKNIEKLGKKEMYSRSQTPVHSAWPVNPLPFQSEKNPFITGHFPLTKKVEEPGEGKAEVDSRKSLCP